MRLTLFFAVFCVGSGLTGLTLTILGNRSPVEREATSEKDSPAGS